MRYAVTIVVVAALLALSIGACWSDLPVATDRGNLSVQKTADAIIIEAYEWEVRHDRNAGGCLSSIELTEVDRQLLSGAMSARVNDWRESYDTQPQTEISEPDERTVVVTVSGHLCSEGGEPSPIAFEHEYRYRREYLRHRVTLTPEEPVEGLTDITVVEIPGVEYERYAACDAFAHGHAYHRHAGIAVRGAIDSEPAVAWEDPLPARSMVMYTGAYGGIDWFPASEVAPWRWDGKKEVGSWRVERADEIAKIVAAVYQDDSPVNMEQECTWEFYTTWPCTTRRFQVSPAVAWMFPEDHQTTREEITYLHEQGIEVVMPACYWETRRWQQDGDDYRFYQHEPSPPLADIIEQSHELGMAFVPYVDLPYGCVTRETYQKIGEKIKRTWNPDPTKQQWWHHANPKKGPAVRGCVWGVGCYGSPEFRELTDEFLNTAWTQQDFDGIYYDHVSLSQCTNPEHGGDHVIADGLFKMLDLTREMMGEGKYLYLHSATELSPCYAVQNYADWVIYYENYAYGMHHELPEGHIHAPEAYYDVFTAANNTAVDLTPAIMGGHSLSPGEVLTKFALWGDPKTFVRRGDPLFQGIEGEPQTERDRRLRKAWEIGRESIRRFKPYDLGRFEFVPVIHEAAIVTHGGYASAWTRDGEVLLLVANLRDTVEEVRVIPQPKVTDCLKGGPLEITVGDGEPLQVSEGRWMRVLRDVQVPPEDYILIHLERTD